MPDQNVILIVDDEPKNRRLLEALLKPEGYAILTAASGEEALELASKKPPDLVLLDVMMPGLDGYEVAGRLKADRTTRNIPIIMVTALDDQNSKLAGLNAGVEEFLTKPVDRAELWVRVRNLLRLKEYHNLLADHNQRLEQAVRERTQDLRDSYVETIFTLTRAAEYKDEDTFTHVQRISYYCRDLVGRLGIADRDFVQAIVFASPMHDIGKIGVPDHILLKPGAFSPDEWELMKSHTTIGADILGNSKSPFLQMGAEIALNHHECWDGSGYPSGVAGDAIPLSARCMCICDVYDAIRSVRPYKRAIDHARAVDIITRGDGRTRPEQFDPEMLEVFTRYHEAFRDIFETCTETACAGPGFLDESETRHAGRKSHDGGGERLLPHDRR